MLKTKKGTRFNRRLFIASLLASVPLGVAADALWLEPDWLKTRTIRLAEKVSHRFVHFTDLHHKGDRRYLERVVATINSVSPEWVCFTGDLIEDNLHLTEALECLAKIKAPLFGIPGNHDYWANADFDKINTAFARNGGAWLVNSDTLLANGRIHLHGLALLKGVQPVPIKGAFNLLLVHYPSWADVFTEQRFDLILAGHTHGGQVRLPFMGPLVLPFDSGTYDLGLFKTGSGPLYVSSGVGCFYVNARFNCRPEIVVFEI